MRISKLYAKQILDSRGNPTLRVFIELENGIKDFADVPSGASKGSHEALELRDNNESIYNGMGVNKACNNVTSIFEKIKEIDVEKQREIDLAMIEFDGTHNKSNIGANAILGVSIACMKASSKLLGKEYYTHINEIFNEYFKKDIGIHFPTPLFNIINGGEHAHNRLDFQEFIVTPMPYKDLDSIIDNSYKKVLDKEKTREDIRKGAEILHTLSQNLTIDGYGQGVGDEGGDSILDISYAKTALNLICEAVIKAGYKLYEDISFGIDCASNYFYSAEKNEYIINRRSKTGKEMALNYEGLKEYYKFFLDNYPLIYLEDPFYEDHMNEFSKFKNDQSIKKILVTGDDLIVTNVERLERAIQEDSVRSVIIKPNQIGTLYETFQVVNKCIDDNIIYVPSHRSGETNDSFITDLAVGLGALFIKAGAPQRGERVAKYNRLLEIADQF